MLVKGKVVIDEAALIPLLKTIFSYFPQAELRDVWVEKNRCITFKIKFQGKLFKLKVRPKVYKGRLACELWKVFWLDIGSINLSGFIKLFASTVKEYLPQQFTKMEFKNNILYFPEIESNFAGILNKELIFEGRWTYDI